MGAGQDYRLEEHGTGEEVKPFRASLFPNCPPYLNFVATDQQQPRAAQPEGVGRMVWHLWSPRSKHLVSQGGKEEGPYEGGWTIPACIKHNGFTVSKVSQPLFRFL